MRSQEFEGYTWWTSLFRSISQSHTEENSCKFRVPRTVFLLTHRIHANTNINLFFLFECWSSPPLYCKVSVMSIITNFPFFPLHLLSKGQRFQYTPFHPDFHLWWLFFLHWKRLLPVLSGGHNLSIEIRVGGLGISSSCNLVLVSPHVYVNLAPPSNID